MFEVNFLKLMRLSSILIVGSAIRSHADGFTGVASKPGVICHVVVFVYFQMSFCYRFSGQSGFFGHHHPQSPCCVVYIPEVGEYVLF